MSVHEMLEATAYHEAGHAVAAVFQHLPLLEDGMHIDMEGSGVTYYCHRSPSPGQFDDSEAGRFEREQTIIALYSGRIAQKTFLRWFDEYDSWKSDWALAAQLIQELALLAPDSPGQLLYNHAERLVLVQWPTIRRLASALWHKPLTPMSQSEFEKGWSLGKKRLEKCMSGSEVRAFFTALQIPCSVRGEPCSIGKAGG